MKIYSDTVLATFAKNMLCPYTLLDNNSDVALSEVGRNDFNRYRYRHHSDFYRGDSKPSQEILLKQMKQALETMLSKNKKPLLLLSDGKDSMSLAVALAEMGRPCDTLTFLRKDDLELKEYVGSVARKLGHTPYFVTVDEILAAFDKDTFLSACAHMETPVLDQGFLFFLFGLKVFFEEVQRPPYEYDVVDGLGNDEYFGYLPSKNQLNAYRLSKLGLWKLVPDAARTLRWYLRSPAESHGDLSSLACFFPLLSAYDLNDYFSNIPHSTEPLAFVDFRAFARGSFHDHQCMMGKTIAAAKHFGSTAVFPWLDAKLADYCFNLPASEKFDFTNLKNKLPLRTMLETRINWQQQKRGVDLYFDLDIESFKKKILTAIVPDKLVERVGRCRILPTYVQQRGYLELLNFVGYCSAADYRDDEIATILSV